MYDFDSHANILEFNRKMRRWLEHQSPDKVKDCLCTAFDTWNPLHIKSHPCHDIIHEGMEYLSNHGWTSGICKDTVKGLQFVAISPDNNCYMSMFRHN